MGVVGLLVVLFIYLYSDYIVEFGDVFIISWVINFVVDFVFLLIIGLLGIVEVVEVMLKVFGYDIGYWIVYYVDLMILLLIEVYEYIVGLVWDCDGVIIWVVFIDYWLVKLMIGFWIEFDGVLVVFVGDIVFCDSFD